MLAGLKRAANAAVIVVCLAALAPRVAAQPPTLTIYEIQFNTTDGDASVYHNQIVNCVGGVVVANIERTTLVS